jgi:hypothetical protein
MAYKHKNNHLPIFKALFSKQFPDMQPMGGEP